MAGPVPSGRWGLLGPGLCLGVGLGGFVDGIVLHQVLQWHHMLSNTDADRLGLATYSARTLPGLEVNTIWDGAFHAFAWLAVLVGLFWLRRRVAAGARVTTRTLVGLLLAGWGLFNLVEGLVDHHLLRVHHVRDDVADPWPWDVGFLALGLLLLVGGLAMTRRAGRDSPGAGGSPAGR